MYIKKIYDFLMKHIIFYDFEHENHSNLNLQPLRNIFYTTGVRLYTWSDVKGKDSILD